MAVLEKIRKRAGIFISIFVGVALVLFIVDQNTIAYLFNDTSNDVAVIDKQKVDYNEYFEFLSIHQNFLHIAQNKSNLSEDENNAIRKLAWQDVLRKYILEPRFKILGLRCGNDELEDLLYGSNISPMISQNFMNPENGLIDTLAIRRFFEEANSNPTLYIVTEYWKTLIPNDRVNTKFNNMISKAMYMPSELAKMSYYESNNKCDFEFVLKSYADVDDASVEITEADYKAYYDSHSSMFKVKEQTRDLEYVVYNVIPSQPDTLNAYERAVELREDFLAIEDNSYLEFAERYSDIAFPNKFVSESSLTPYLVSIGFFNETVGATSQISLQDDSFYFTRIVEEAVRPDSTMASHILIMPNENRDIARCRQIIDSLNTLISNGADFALLAMMNSDDPGSKDNGGDLGWFTDGAMVPQFNEACFGGKVGDVKTVETQYGIHILKIIEQTLAKRKLKFASVSKEIRPSVKTMDYYYSKASAFAMENNDAEKFENAIEEEKLVKRVASQLESMDNQISGVGSARELVQWAFGEKTQKGEISKVFSFENLFVVAKLADIHDKGIMSLESAKDKMQAILLRNKKADLIIADFNKLIEKNNSNLYDMASQLNARLDTSFNINFNSFSIPGVGVEPNVNAVAAKLDQNQISKPIKGNNGVFVLKVIAKTASPEKSDFSEEQISGARTISNQVFRVLETIKENANIKDNRVKYF